MRESDYLHANPETVAVFLKIPTLKHFGKDLTKILELSKIKKYDVGETIIREGDNDKWIFCLISGEAEVIKEEEKMKR